jgi:hypothetical protein
MIMEQLPVKNCALFLGPTDASTWTRESLSGVVGVFMQEPGGQAALVDVFDVEHLPGYEELINHGEYATWVSVAGGKQHLRFDMYPMPFADVDRRREVVSLIQRSCGVHTYVKYADYRKAA